MTPQEVAEATKRRAMGESDSSIAESFGISRQHVGQMLGSRRATGTPPALPPKKPRTPPPIVSREAFAKALKAWRDRRALTQVDAADLLRVNPMTLAQWEWQTHGCSLAASMLLLMESLDALRAAKNKS